MNSTMASPSATKVITRGAKAGARACSGVSLKPHGVVIRRHYIPAALSVAPSRSASYRGVAYQPIRAHMPKRPRPPGSPELIPLPEVTDFSPEAVEQRRKEALADEEEVCPRFNAPGKSVEEYLQIMQKLKEMQFNMQEDIRKRKYEAKLQRQAEARAQAQGQAQDQGQQARGER